MIDVLQKLFAFAVTLGVLITFHELGHYFVARLAGVKVLRFSIGFGRVVWSRRVGPDATEWAISAVPLGGYVKMVDEREGEIAPGDRPRALRARPRELPGSAERRGGRARRSATGADSETPGLPTGGREQAPAGGVAGRPDGWIGVEFDYGFIAKITGSMTSAITSSDRTLMMLERK